MEGKLKLVEERVPVGTATVKALFGTGKRRVAGCAVMDGKLAKVNAMGSRQLGTCVDLTSQPC